MELEDLANRKFSLDAVDDLVSAKDYANGIRFRLDGVVYEVIEDEEDGYRSSMQEIRAVHTRPRNIFVPTEVVSSFGTSDGMGEVLYFHDTRTAKVVLEVGTDYSDDYYPGFVASFHPENMVSNEERLKAFSDISAKLVGVRAMRRKLVTGED